MIAPAGRAQGYPVDIHDFKVVLDKRMYRGIEGLSTLTVQNKPYRA